MSGSGCALWMEPRKSVSGNHPSYRADHERVWRTSRFPLTDDEVLPMGEVLPQAVRTACGRRRLRSRTGLAKTSVSTAQTEATSPSTWNAVA